MNNARRVYFAASLYHPASKLSVAKVDVWQLALVVSLPIIHLPLAHGTKQLPTGDLLEDHGDVLVGRHDKVTRQAITWTGAGSWKYDGFDHITFDQFQEHRDQFAIDQRPPTLVSRPASDWRGDVADINHPRFVTTCPSTSIVKRTKHRSKRLQFPSVDHTVPGWRIGPRAEVARGEPERNGQGRGCIRITSHQAVVLPDTSDGVEAMCLGLLGVQPLHEGLVIWLCKILPMFDNRAPSQDRSQSCRFIAESRRGVCGAGGDCIFKSSVVGWHDAVYLILMPCELLLGSRFGRPKTKVSIRLSAIKVLRAVCYRSLIAVQVVPCFLFGAADRQLHFSAIRVGLILQHCEFSWEAMIRR